MASIFLQKDKVEEAMQYYLDHAMQKLCFFLIDWNGGSSYMVVSTAGYALNSAGHRHML
jgi:hypothetical protein